MEAAALAEIDRMTDVEDVWGIVANHREGDKAIPKGGQCWLRFSNRGGGYETNEMYARSRGSRWIRKWVRADRLESWRVKWVPPALRGEVFGEMEKGVVEARLADIFRCFELDG